MKIITSRDAIKAAIVRFRKQYGDGTYGMDKRGRAIGKELAELDSEIVSKDVVNEIIGNTGWCDLKCDGCGEHDAGCVIELGEPDDYESHSVQICIHCVDKCFRLAHGILRIEL